MASTRPIVVLDSGLGGLTVVRALRRALPAEDIVYFGDTARLPYGSKTAATVGTFVRQIIAYLQPLHPKHVIIACNTATALALPAARAAFPHLSISGVIEPGSKAAIVAAGTKRVPVIGIAATEATIKSKAYERAIIRRRQHARLLMRPCPLLVPIIEEGRSNSDPLVRLALKQYLDPLTERGLDVLVLGCTHYPMLKPAIVATVGPKVAVIDSAERCAQDVARRLREAGTLRREVARTALGDGAEAPPAAYVGTLQTFVTDDPARFARLGSRFLGTPIDEPTWVAADDLYELTSKRVTVDLRTAG